jgi:DMSO/TMAO reductase YedYZ molybdopterin-dependent catalytic subunit
LQEEGDAMNFDRRRFLAVSASGLAWAGAAYWPVAAAELAAGPAALPDGARASAELAALPGKLPLIKRTWRPPNFETPVSYFDEAFTPNAAFFVRYHLAQVPEVDAARWRLAIGGDALDRPHELTLAQLRSEFETVELNAVCMCSGNRRGLSNPHVPGVQWGHGAIGNARWRGVRLKDVLARAALRKEALEIVFDGADAGVLDKTPDFVKSIPVWKALDEGTLLAFEMNGAPLPHWNGFPVRVVVPGWTATYWMKHVTSIQAVSAPHRGFWMAAAYRIPKGKFPVVDRFVSQETEANTPITEMVVNSLITNLADGQRFALHDTVEVRGVAWDGGYGIAAVDASHDGGRSWRGAELGPDLGRYSWRQWRYAIPAAPAGEYVIMARASNHIGATQTYDLVFNPAGYHNNVMERIAVRVG